MTGKYIYTHYFWYVLRRSMNSSEHKSFAYKKNLTDLHQLHLYTLYMINSNLKAVSSNFKCMYKNTGICTH